jgi:hypothetical protein
MATHEDEGGRPRERSSRPTGSGGIGGAERGASRASTARAPGIGEHEVLAEIIIQQEAKVLALARRIVPHVTAEDVRNPHDFPALVASADFNYEDGILAGMKAAEMALRAAARRAPDPPPKGR